MLVDTAGLTLVQHPARFDVILTENTFGDILSDVAAGVAGGLGLAASASLGDGAARASSSRCTARLPDIAGPRDREPGRRCSARSRCCSATRPAEPELAASLWSARSTRALAISAHGRRGRKRHDGRVRRRRCSSSWSPCRPTP